MDGLLFSFAEVVRQAHSFHFSGLSESTSANGYVSAHYTTEYFKLSSQIHKVEKKITGQPTVAYSDCYGCKSRWHIEDFIRGHLPLTEDESKEAVDGIFSPLRVAKTELPAISASNSENARRHNAVLAIQ
ncbi:hypothetical protein Tco_0126945 [Tanacetum coccineum]